MALTHRQSSVSESPSRPSTPDFGRAIGFVAGGIGDQIYHLGQLRALAAACQTATIDIACIHPGPISRILAATPWVGRVVDARPLRRYKPWSRTSETVTALRHSRYDTAFFMHRSTSFKLAARTAGIPRRIGLADGFFDRMLLDTPLALTDGGARREAWGHRPFIAAMDEYVIGSGLDLAPDIPTIIPDKNATRDARRLVASLPGPISVVNLFAVDEKRRWPVEAAIETIRQLAVGGGSFILNAGPDAAEAHRQALACWHSACKADKRIRPDQLVDSLGAGAGMERDVALYHLADRYIGVDSFTANLAMNCNLPAVILFASVGDSLSYRSVTKPVTPEQPGDLGTISSGDVLAAVGDLGPRRTAAPEAHPLPV